MLTLFGLFAVAAMLICYALEDRFGLIELIWSLVAVRRWMRVRQLKA